MTSSCWGGALLARLPGLLVWVVLAGTEVEGVARADSETLSLHLEGLLSAGIEASEAHNAVFALGEEGERALIGVFEREGAPRHARLRALGLLQAFGTETSARYFERLVRASRAGDASLGELHPARSALVLRRALTGLLATAKLLSPPIATDAVAACLAHPDAHVRSTASELLATLEDGRVERLLEKRLAGERSRMVRASLTRALTSRSARPQAPR